MSDMTGLPIPDYSVAAETPQEHLRNVLVLLGGLRRAMQLSGLDAVDAETMVAAISARLGKALAQIEERHEFGCTAYVGRPCICATLRNERASGSRPAASHEAGPA